jgi:hypothetical protein
VGLREPEADERRAKKTKKRFGEEVDDDDDDDDDDDGTPRESRGEGGRGRRRCFRDATGEKCVFFFFFSRFSLLV